MLKVFNIQRYSIQDGNGIRTNIFFKGCPLNCLWCNNPESIDPLPSIMFDERMCRMFGDCIAVAGGSVVAEDNKLIINRGKITDYKSLNDVCPSQALIVVGKEMSVQEIIAEVEKDIPFYEMSGGGVTLTGGEPFSQNSDFKELLIGLKERGIHISVETSLHIPWETIEKYIDHIDVFLADLKHLDSEKFTRFTGGNAELAISNFQKLSEKGKQIIVRIPVIPSFNFSEHELHLIIDFAAGLRNVTEINFIPFHSLASEKYAMLGKEYLFEKVRKVEKEELFPFVEYAATKGVAAKILN